MSKNNNRKDTIFYKYQTLIFNICVYPLTVVLLYPL